MNQVKDRVKNLQRPQVGISMKLELFLYENFYFGMAKKRTKDNACNSVIQQCSLVSIAILSPFLPACGQ